jgi:hypothetical protein
MQFKKALVSFVYGFGRRCFGYTNILPKEFVVTPTFRIKKVSVFNISRYYRNKFVSFAELFSSALDSLTSISKPN